MYKVIDLGTEFSSTGEPLVQEINAALCKTASVSSEIKKFWDTLQANDRYTYLWVIGLSAWEYYGCNNNGDAFTEDNLKKYHPTFVENAHIFLHHVNKDPKKSIGRPTYSWYNEDLHRVELVLQIDKTNPAASDVIAKIRRGEMIAVSMGCRVKYDVCSICGKQAKTRAEYCEHTRYNMKKILPDGRQVFVFNPEPKFFDISVVNRPADPVALTLAKVASTESIYAGSSAALGEESERLTVKRAALGKLADIIKSVNGTGTRAKDSEIPALDKLDLSKLDYPVMGFDELEDMKVTPGCVVRGMLANGAPLSLGELAYASGKHHLGSNFRPEHIAEILRLLPWALQLLKASTSPLEPTAQPILDNYEGELEAHPELIEQFAPTARTRICILKHACDSDALSKMAAEVIEYLPTGIGMRRAKITPRSTLTNKGPALTDQYEVVTSDGRTLKTDRRSIESAKRFNQVESSTYKVLGGALGAAALAGLLVDPRSTANILGSLALGGISSMFVGRSGSVPAVVSTSGVEIPVNTLFTSTEKVAATKLDLGLLAGLGVPTALGLDYLYNTKVKYKGVPDPGVYMEGATKAKHRAGQAVVDNPATALAGGLLAFKSIPGLAKKLRRG